MSPMRATIEGTVEHRLSSLLPVLMLRGLTDDARIRSQTTEYRCLQTFLYILNQEEPEQLP